MLWSAGTLKHSWKRSHKPAALSGVIDETRHRSWIQDLERSYRSYKGIYETASGSFRRCSRTRMIRAGE